MMRGRVEVLAPSQRIINIVMLLLLLLMLMELVELLRLLLVLLLLMVMMMVIERITHGVRVMGLEDVTPAIVQLPMARMEGT